jgi:hypothetical protein
LTFKIPIPNDLYRKEGTNCSNTMNGELLYLAGDNLSKRNELLRRARCKEKRGLPERAGQHKAKDPYHPRWRSQYKVKDRKNLSVATVMMTRMILTETDNYLLDLDEATV